MIFHSDDWGRVGMPDPKSVERLGAYGFGKSAWDWYGLETPADIQALANVLRRFSDDRGHPACFTANFVLANADLRRMGIEGFREFRSVAIKDGFPEPWTDEGLMECYLGMIQARLFYPGLHGFVHFSPDGFMAACHDVDDPGDRARALVREDIPYAASLTPEFNFALVSREQGKETFIPAERQRDWVAKGVELFARTFGCAPVTTCAPGYRCNAATYRLWREANIGVVQTADAAFLGMRLGLLNIARNTFFEPVFQGPGCVDGALAQARSAVALGKPIVVCTHSINFISRHNGRTAESLALLSDFLSRLMAEFPNLRFSNDAEVLVEWAEKSSQWFAFPRMQTVWDRMRQQRIETR